MYLLCQLCQRQYCLELLLASLKHAGQLHELHQRKCCHGLQVATVLLLAFEVKGHGLQELRGYLVAVLSVSVGEAVSRVTLTLLLTVCAQQDQL